MHIQDLLSFGMVVGMSIFFPVVLVSFGSLYHTVIITIRHPREKGLTSYEAAAAMSSWESWALWGAFWMGP